VRRGVRRGDEMEMGGGMLDLGGNISTGPMLTQSEAIPEQGLAIHLP
jgi:hypothetical protein